jgi:proline iminopeptidase
MALAGKPYLPLAYVKNLLGWPLKTSYTLDDMADDALGLLAPAHRAGARDRRVDGRHDRASEARAAAGAQPDVHHVEQRPARLARPHAGRAQCTVATSETQCQPRRADGPHGRHRARHRQSRLSRVGKLLYQRIEAALERGSCPEGVARQMVAIAASGERTALLPSISCPALVIHGAADPDPVACGIDTAALIPGARMEVIEGMGHDMPPQLIERLLALIDVHLQGKMAPQMRSQPAQARPPLD